MLAAIFGGTFNQAAIEQGVPELAEDVSELYALHIFAKTYGWTPQEIDMLGQFTSASLMEIITVENLLKNRSRQK